MASGVAGGNNREDHAAGPSLGIPAYSNFLAAIENSTPEESAIAEDVDRAQVKWSLSDQCLPVNYRCMWIQPQLKHVFYSKDSMSLRHCSSTKFTGSTLARSNSGKMLCMMPRHDSAKRVFPTTIACGSNASATYWSSS